MMHMDRAPEVVEAAKELSSRRNDFVLHHEVSSAYSVDANFHVINDSYWLHGR